MTIWWERSPAAGNGAGPKMVSAADSIAAGDAVAGGDGAADDAAGQKGGEGAQVDEEMKADDVEDDGLVDALAADERSEERVMRLAILARNRRDARPIALDRGFLGLAPFLGLVARQEWRECPAL